KENLNNKVTVLSSTSNNTQYPAAKAVYDALAAKANTGDVQVKLPVGTILMYDGTGWRDNVTLVGWYACNKANSDAGRTPNLQDRFIMGSSTRGSVGGNNSVTIKSNNLPNHTHTFTGTNATGDLEAVLGNDVKGKNPSGVFSNTVSNDWNSWTPGSGVKNADTQVRFSMTPAGSVTGGGSNTPTALDNRPNYYTVIYIKRIA
ncbi:MAG: hypothetical protein LBQ83_03590, partial [Candidatus Margulisbacteria bacterium]|nr:hypothetical protein [Candidatus Margulisiibacteriota bacterium]